MKFAWDILKKLFIKIFGKIGYLFVNNNIMGQRIILSEDEKLNIQKMYGLINEQRFKPTKNIFSYKDTIKFGLKKSNISASSEIDEVLLKNLRELKDFMSKGKKRLRLYLKNIFIQNNEKIVIVNLSDDEGKEYKISEVTKDNGKWWITLGDKKILLSELDEYDVNDQLNDLSNMTTVEDKLLLYLPILTKTENELKDIQRKEMVNQVMNTNETNRGLLNNIDDFWENIVKGTGWEERYERPFNMVKRMIQSQKIDGDYIHEDFKWFSDIIRLSKSEFEDFVRDVKNLEDLLEKYNITKDMVVENKDRIIRQLTNFGRSQKVPKDLDYRIRPIQRMIDQNFTGHRPPPTDDVADKPSTVRRRN